MGFIGLYLAVTKKTRAEALSASQVLFSFATYMKFRRAILY